MCRDGQGIIFVDIEISRDRLFSFSNKVQPKLYYFVINLYSIRFDEAFCIRDNGNINCASLH